MELNSSLQIKLDAPTKTFEVAFRSFVVDRLLSNYVDEAAFKAELQNRVNIAKNAGFIFSGKISSLNKLLNANAWREFWDNLRFIHDCYNQKKHTISHDVTYLHDTIMMIYVFQELYQDFIQTYQSVEKYVYYSEQYYEIRNALSHQGSSIVTKDDALDCIEFMKIAVTIIEEEYFWYRSSNDILNDISEFENMINSAYPQIENLDKVPYPTNEIVCREPEIKNLFINVCGWDSIRKLRNRKHLVCISGYGGVGKTSLVAEFVRRLIDNMSKDSYKGLRPAFILFYSAKEQMLDYDLLSGEIYIKGLRSQFSNHEELLSSLYRDLRISEFDDNWTQEGILIIDNFESLDGDNRKKTIDFINYDLPMTVHVIITTRIPEHADEQMELKGFQDVAGLTFIKEYLEKNDVNVVLNQEQQSNLVRCSYGNSLVLVLALKRLSSGISTYHSLINEMQRLPKNDADSYISQFMFQNTIEEVMRSYPDSKDLIKSILICLSMRQALDADIIASAHRHLNITVGEVEEVLQLLARYLIVEKTGDAYHINEFANHFIIVSLSPSMGVKKEWESRLLTAIHEKENQKKNLEELKAEYPQLSALLEEWNGKSEDESYAICRAFTLYNERRRITRNNAAYEIEHLEQEFDRIEHQYHAHPYVYYQWARILRELRHDNIIGNEYNDKIRTNYERAIMLIDMPTFKQIKNTKTYPSILWIYSLFLLDIGCYDECSRYAYAAILNFEQVGEDKENIFDAWAIYGLAETFLFGGNFNKEHLMNARTALSRLQKAKRLKKNAEEHKRKLENDLNKYSSFR